jgi:FMN-dependent NADH-azoreductase
VESNRARRPDVRFRAGRRGSAVQASRPRQEDVRVRRTGDSGYESGEPYEPLNHLDPYLRTVFGFIGVNDITFVYVGNDEFGGQRLAQSVARARERIAELIAA